MSTRVSRMYWRRDDQLDARALMRPPTMAPVNTSSASCIMTPVAVGPHHASGVRLRPAVSRSVPANHRSRAISLRTRDGHVPVVHVPAPSRGANDLVDGLAQMLDVLEADVSALAAADAVICSPASAAA